MNNRSFTILEYTELLALVRRGAQTPMGRARVEVLAPLADLARLRRELSAVGQCIELRKRAVVWSFHELNDASDSLSRLKIDGTGLDPLAILELARLCEQALAARAAIRPERDAAPVVWKVVAELPTELNSLVARIKNKILPGGELDDRASPELARIRHEIVRVRSSVTRSLENLMRRSAEAIQDELVTVRNERFVIPVRSDHRGRIQGVAHGFSSSGATVFVEPLETIDANNELQSLREIELQEIAKILFGLSEELRSQLPAIEMASDAITELDFLSAKAVFAEKFECVVPEITGTAGVPPASTNAKGALTLVDARHPLLEENLRASGGSVVPVSFSLGESASTMIISGANAGGKTVVLKTAGLISLMALSGLPVPAREATVPFYASVLADIGDHQSLAANLSTFTSHVANISRMIESCQAPALVLLDEVGTGTDPEEGSALGVAVVDHFRRVCGAHVLATTHYSGLKMYAATEQGVLNASVEFDEKTLKPTYRLMVGLAGSSSGLEIARRFGIPDPVVEAAADRLKESSREATQYLRRIKRESEEATELRRALEEERTAVAEKYATLDKEAERRERTRQVAFERELDKRIIEVETLSRDLVSTIQERSERLKIEREARPRMAELKRKARQAIGAAQNAAASTTAAGSTSSRNVRVVRDGQIINRESRPIAHESETEVRYASAEAREIVPGDHVRLRTFGSVGIVDQVKGDEAEVRVKSLRFREKIENLELVEAAPEPKETGRAAKLRVSRGTELKLALSNESPRSELNVIGQRTDEAVDAVDKFLDEAALNGLAQVLIVHGHGTGALRRAIGELLEGHPHVQRFSPAPPDKGGGGATIIELRQ
jgi:DNA mismatch repair protein MutS2